MTPQIKEAARLRVRAALLEGIIEKPITCTCCHLIKKLEAHHVDYSTPLDVVWVCHNCHMTIYHGEKKTKRLERTKYIEALLAKGYTQAQVAQEFGISRQAVNQLLDRDKQLIRLKRYKDKDVIIKE